jgi:hypothetical protein
MMAMCFVARVNSQTAEQFEMEDELRIISSFDNNKI